VTSPSLYPSTMARRVSTLKWGEALGAWVCARLAVGMGFVVAEGIRSNLRPDADLIHMKGGLLTYDAGWYRDLAERGYAGVPREGLRFFPLYHVVSRWLAWPFGGNSSLMLVIVANVSALVCLVLLHRLVLEEFGDDDLARRSMWVLALFPAAGTFVFGYSESLMLMLTLAMLLAVRRRSWLVAILFGILAGLCRPLAVLLVVPLAVDGLKGWNRVAFNERLLRLTTIGSPMIGVAAYLFYVGGTFGDWMEPITIQRGLRRGFQDPFTRLWDAFADLRSTLVGTPNLAFALVFAALLVVAARRQRMSWFLYALATWLVAMSANNIDSIGRYGLVAFPFVVAIAQLARSERAMWVVMTVSSAALTGLTVMTLLGRYVP
jgi:hypothetical protein